MRHVHIPTRWQVSGRGAPRPKRPYCPLNRAPELFLPLSIVLRKQRRCSLSTCRIRGRFFSDKRSGDRFHLRLRIRSGLASKGEAVSRPLEKKELRGPLS